MVSLDTTPFGITVHDKGFAKVGDVGAPLAVKVVVNHNQQSTAEIDVLSGAARLPDLLTLGARVVITFHGDQLLTGTVTAHSKSGPAKRPVYKVMVSDDWAWMQRMLAWPTPGAATPASGGGLVGQTMEFDVRTGAAESVVKAIVTANKGRGTPGVTVAADLGRGGSITVKNRFNTLIDITLPLLDAAGIGVTFRQSGAGLVMDCYAGRTYPRTLTEESGVVQDSTVSWAAPKATRVVVAGAGSGTSRVFTLVVDAALEAALGYSIEAFLDESSTTTDAERNTAGLVFLAQNAVTAGLTVTLAQTSVFSYDVAGTHGGIRVGDMVPVQVIDGLIVNALLRSCTLTYDTSAGLQVVPQVGDLPSVNNTLAGQFASIAKIVRHLGRR